MGKLSPDVTRPEGVLTVPASPHPADQAPLDEEWRLRRELAAVYRLVAHFRMTDLIFTHISARLPGPEHHFLINPYGLLFEEITASNLVKVDLSGRPVEDTPHPVNPAGFVIHSAIHAARPDAHCVLHTHTKAGCAVAAQEDGLLPLNQISMEFYGRVGYHDYEGVALNLAEQRRLVADLADHPAMILRNHGLLTVGETPSSAWWSASRPTTGTDAARSGRRLRPWVRGGAGRASWRRTPESRGTAAASRSGGISRTRRRLSGDRSPSAG